MNFLPFGMQNALAHMRSAPAHVAHQPLHPAAHELIMQHIAKLNGTPPPPAGGVPGGPPPNPILSLGTGGGVSPGHLPAPTNFGSPPIHAWEALQHPGVWQNLMAFLQQAQDFSPGGRFGHGPGYGPQPAQHNAMPVPPRGLSPFGGANKLTPTFYNQNRAAGY